MEQNILIQVENLCGYFGKAKIVNDVSFNIQKQTITAVIGPNGSGKTSILDIISSNSLLKLTGSVLFKEGITISYLPQSISINELFPISVKELIYTINGRVFDKSAITCKHANSEEYREFIFSIYKQFCIDELLDKLVIDLSGGMQKKVLLFALLLRDSDIYVLDEPVANFDSSSRAIFYNIISTLRSKFGKTFVISSHDLFVVIKNADKVICLDLGCLKCSGKPDDVAGVINLEKILDYGVSFYTHKDTN